MSNRTFTFQELKEFVFSKKDEGKVDMSQNSSLHKHDKDYCGCILVQFFRKKFKNKVFLVGHSCGVLSKKGIKYRVSAIPSDIKKVSDFIYKAVHLNPKTYKQVKEIIQKL